MQPADPILEMLHGIRDDLKDMRHDQSSRADVSDLRNDTRSIRDDVSGLRESVAAVGDDVAGLRGDMTDHRADVTDLRGDVHRLERRQTESEVRLAAELAAVTSAARDVRDLLRTDLALRDRLMDHERRIAAIEARHT